MREEGGGAHCGNSSSNVLSAFAVDAAGVYMIESPTRAVHVNATLDSVVRVQDFVATGGSDTIHSVVAGASYFFACGVAGGDNQASIWRFTRDSLAQRYRDFAAAGGYQGVDAVASGSSVLFLMVGLSGVYTDFPVVVVIDEELDSTLQKAYVPDDFNALLPVGVAQKDTGHVITAYRTSTEVAYVVIDSALDVVSSKAITLGTAVNSQAVKPTASGNTLIMAFRNAAQTAAILVCVDVSTHTVAWAKNFASTLFYSVVISGTSVFAVGQRLATSRMLVMELSLATGATIKANGFSAHTTTTGSLIFAGLIGSMLWLGGTQSTGEAENTFGSDDLQIFNVEGITDDAPAITITDVSTTVNTLTVTKEPDFPDPTGKTNSTGTAVTGYEIEPTTFVI